MPPYIHLFQSSSYFDRHVMISYDIIHPEPAGGNGKLEQLTEIPLKNKKIKNNKVIFTDYTL